MAGRWGAREWLSDDVVVDLRGRNPVIDASVYVRDRSFYERSVKPAIDVLGALVLLVLTLPLLLACAIAVFVTMGRPVFLLQNRVGQGGRVFRMVKFRTMHADRRVEQAPFDGPDRRKTHKSADDPRITPVGSFLRKWSLDELPQLANVLLGDMSLVGPRPEMIDIVVAYEPWQHRRHAVKPGITGPWQVSERGEKMLHECTDLDIEYLERVSMATDAKLLLMTPLAALGVRRGY